MRPPPTPFDRQLELLQRKLERYEEAFMEPGTDTWAEGDEDEYLRLEANLYQTQWDQSIWKETHGSIFDPDTQEVPLELDLGTDVADTFDPRKGTAAGAQSAGNAAYAALRAGSRP